MKTKRSHEGYLLIDHRNSPGVPAELVRSSGLGGPAVGAGQTYESPMIICSHCGGGVIINPMRTREREYCPGCDHYLCDNCGLLKKLGHPCKPFKRVLAEAHEQAVRNLGKDN